MRQCFFQGCGRSDRARLLTHHFHGSLVLCPKMWRSDVESTPRLPLQDLSLSCGVLLLEMPQFGLALNLMTRPGKSIQILCAAVTQPVTFTVKIWAYLSTLGCFRDVTVKNPKIHDLDGLLRMRNSDRPGWRFHTYLYRMHPRK